VDTSNDELIGQLKEGAHCIAFYATLLGKGVDEIGRAISLSEWYGLSVRVSQPEFLAEIIERPVDEGIAAANAELKRQAAARKAFAEERTRFQADVASERKRLAKAAHDYKAAEAELESTRATLTKREGLLTTRESQLQQVEDLTAEKHRVQQERLAVQGFLAAEKERLQSAAAAEFDRRIEEANAEHQRRTAELDGRTTDLAAREERLVAGQAAHRTLRRRVLAFQLVVFCILATAAFLPVRDRIVRPFLDARSAFVGQKKELAAQEHQLAAWQDSLTQAQANLQRGRQTLAATRDSLAHVKAALSDEADAEQHRESAARVLAAELTRREQALDTQNQRQQQRESDLARRERVASEEQAQLDQHQSGLAAREQQVQAEASQLATQQAMVTAELGTRRPAQYLGSVHVQVGNGVQNAVAVSGSVGGVPFALDRSGLAFVGLRPGVQQYVVTVRSRMPGPYGWRFVDWTGSGVVDVPPSGALFLVRGEYPRLWLERR
jgi:hypothetical protein